MQKGRSLSSALEKSQCLSGSGTVGSATTRKCQMSVRGYGWDKWLGAVCVQLLLSIFLSDGRGERQHAVICCAAAADSSKSLARSHLPHSEMAWGGYLLKWKCAPPPPPPPHRFDHVGICIFHSYTYSLEWIIEMAVQNWSGLLFNYYLRISCDS